MSQLIQREIVWPDTSSRDSRLVLLQLWLVEDSYDAHTALRFSRIHDEELGRIHRVIKIIYKSLLTCRYYIRM